jgi:hypothetical protein
MNNHILNIINQFMCYSDPSVTDNPHQRAFDHRRAINTLSVKNPYSSSKVLAPGQSFKLIDSTTEHGFQAGSTILTLDLISAEESLYRLSVSGPADLKTARSVSSITSCAVTVNNNAVVEFNFSGATLTGVQAGDLLRIKGAVLHDSGVCAFNPLNSGFWKILAVSGTKVSCVRPAGDVDQAIAENIADASSDVEFFADDGVQKGNKISISGTLSVVSQRVYEIKDVTPSYIDFVSTQPLPLESDLAYEADSIVIYSMVKKFFYIECDQECVIRFNGDTGDSNKLSPIAAGNSQLPAFMSKVGDSYICEIVNKSINSCNIKFFTCE